MESDESSDFELLRQFLISPVRQFGIVTATASDQTTLDATRQQAAAAVAAAGVTLATLDVQPGSSILDQMVVAAKNADVLFVDHLDRVLFDSVGAPLVTPDIELLNWDRDQLPRLLRAHTVLWLLPSAAHALALVARDLNDVAMARYHFVGAAVQSSLDLPMDWSFTGQSRPEGTVRELELLDQLLAKRQPGSVSWAEAAAFRAHRALQANDLIQARTLWEQALAIFNQSGDHGGAMGAAFGLADVASRLDGAVAGIAFARANVVPHAHEAGAPRFQALVHSWIAIKLLQAGRSAEGEVELRHHVLPLLERLDDKRQLAIAHRLLAGALLVNGKSADALNLLREKVIPAFERLGDQTEVAVSRLRLASTLAASGNADAALREFQFTLGELPEESPNLSLLRATTLESIATLLVGRGDAARGQEVWRDQAIPIYERLGDNTSVERIRRRLDDLARPGRDR